ncbi:MAG: hypothetical protein WBH69_02930, partial [Fervidobacterium sp.]
NRLISLLIRTSVRQRYLVDSMRKLRIPYTIEIIKGHSGNDFHNAVDRLAKAEARKAAGQIL